MVSSFYSSNEAKERKYQKENKIRELNQALQQEVVDAQIAENLGLEAKATKLSILSKRITDKLVGVKPDVLKGDALLLRSINNGQLSDLFEKIKLLKDSSLTKTQQSIRDNLNVQRNKDIINELIQEAVPNGVDAIKNVLINSLGGDGNQESVLELITKADKINLKEFKDVVKPEGLKSYQRENKLMGKEDINIRPRYPKILPPTDTVRPRTRMDYENEFDIPMEKMLMSNEDTLSRLTTMNANQDYALREKFDNVLDGIATEAKSVADKRLWKQMKAAIERQRMEDAYKEWVENATKSAFADKIQKNLKALVWNQKLKQLGEREMMGMEDINYSQPIPKSRSNSNETTTTEQGSIAGVSNRGRPPPTKEEELARMYKKKQEADELFLKFIAKDKNGKNLYTGKERTDINQTMKNKYAAADKIAKKYNLK